MRAAALLVLLGACHVTASEGVGGRAVDASGGGGGGGGGEDAPAAGGDAAADGPAPLGMFGTPTPLTVAADPNKQEDDAALSNSGLEIVFAVVDGGNNGTKHLYWASRTSTTAAFGPAVKTGFATDLTHNDENVRWSADDTIVYFASNRTPNLGGADIWQVPHTPGANAWGTPARISSVSGATTDKWFTTCDGGGYLLARADGNGVTHIYGGTGYGTAAMTAPAIVGELVAPTGAELGTQLSQDCLTVWFASTRDGTYDLWTATRATATGVWNAPTKLTMFSTDQYTEQDPWMSPDLRTFVFASNALGTNDVYITTR